MGCKQCEKYSAYLANLDNLIGVSQHSSRPRECFISDMQKELAMLRSENDNLKRLLLAASHALRSYEYGNASTELAKSMADSIDQATQKGSE